MIPRKSEKQAKEREKIFVNPLIKVQHPEYKYKTFTIQQVKNGQRM